MDGFAAARLLVGTAFLFAAAASDIRTRKVRDPLWIALGSLGLAILVTELVAIGAGLERFALVLATAVLFYAIFFGEPLLDEEGFSLRPVRLAGYAGAALLVAVSASEAYRRGGAEAGAFTELLAMPAMVLVYQGFYQIGLLHGGADTKGMIALTLLMPTYANASPFPLLAADPRVEMAIRAFFPFSLVVLVDAAVLFLFVPLVYLARNAARGDLAFPQALFGYRVPLDALPRHAWLMEKINARGEHILVLFPRRGGDPEGEAQRLREAGRATAWVQPKVPFMVPLLVGFLLAFFVGNLLLGLFPG